MQSQSALSELSVVAIPTGPSILSESGMEGERPIQSDSWLRHKNKRGLEGTLQVEEHLRTCMGVQDP